MAKCPWCGEDGPPFAHIDCFLAMSREMATEAFRRQLAAASRDDVLSGNVWPEDDQ